MPGEVSSHVQILREWLTKFKSLPKSSIEKYGQELKKDGSIFSSLEAALFNSSDNALGELLQPICHQLFEFYNTELV